MTEPGDPPGLRAIRRLMRLLLVAGMVGTAADLMLLNHHEGPWQMVPLVVLGLGLASSAAAAARDDAATISVMRVVMALFIGAGLIGMGLHYNGNSEFQRELDPSQQGWRLFVNVVTAKAPPALAPAAMIQLGLLGLLSTYRHPALRPPWQRDQSESSGA
jgi:hypothetical protein